MDSTYHPEIDESPLLAGDKIGMYRMLIGSLQWAVTLCRFDVAHATNMLARYTTMPREGHMKAAHRAIGYLKHFIKGRIRFDIRTLTFADTFDVPSESIDWCQQYPNMTEELPGEIPLAVFNPIQLTSFVDADHAACKVTRRSVTGILHFLESTPWQWHVGMQRTVETSTYGSEFIAARIATEQAIDHRYRLRMMGVPIDNATLIVGDNRSVQTSGSKPSSSLSKKHLSIAYHKVRENVAAGIIIFAWIGTKFNIADLLTKPLNGMSFRSLTSFWIFGKGLCWFAKGSVKSKSDDYESHEV